MSARLPKSVIIQNARHKEHTVIARRRNNPVRPALCLVGQQRLGKVAMNLSHFVSHWASVGCGVMYHMVNACTHQSDLQEHDFCSLFTQLRSNEARKQKKSRRRPCWGSMPISDAPQNLHDTQSHSKRPPASKQVTKSVTDNETLRASKPQVLSAQLASAGLVGENSFGKLLMQKAAAVSAATPAASASTSTASAVGASATDTTAAHQQSVTDGAQADLFQFLRSGAGAFPGTA